MFEMQFIFYLVVIVSGYVEVDFDFGMKINFDVICVILECVCVLGIKLCVVFISLVVVFGGELLVVVLDNILLML